MPFLNTERIKEIIAGRFPGGITTIDSHTAGEPTRLIVAGFPDIPGKNMEEKTRYFKTHLDHIRLSLTREPRGHRGIMAAVLTEPVSDGASFGLIYMDARRYPYLCGHATIGAVATLIGAGVIAAHGTETEVMVDTPSGPMAARAVLENGRVKSVAIRMVPSFVFQTDAGLDLPELGRISVDTVCVGGFFAMVSAEEIGLPLIPENSSRLIRLGMDIIEEANRQLTVRHPLRPEVMTVDVTEFYEPSGHTEGFGKSAVIYGESHMDRSPCGTGTTAKLALLHHKGLIKAGQVFRNAGPLNTVFDARIVAETRIGDFPAVEVEIQGAAHITGMHTFFTDDSDPLSQGFLL